MLSVVVHDLWPLPSWCGGWFWSDGPSQLMFLVFFSYLTLLKLWEMKLQKTALNTPDTKASLSKKFFVFLWGSWLYRAYFLCSWPYKSTSCSFSFSFVCHVTTVFSHLSFEAGRHFRLVLFYLKRRLTIWTLPLPSDTGSFSFLLLVFYYLSHVEQNKKAVTLINSYVWCWLSASFLLIVSTGLSVHRFDCSM